MKHFLTLFLLLLCHCVSPAQTDSLQPSQQEIAFVTKLVDSLPYFIQAGQAVLPRNPECQVLGHNNYVIAHNMFSFWEKVLELNDHKKKAYVLMYAYERLSTAYFGRQDYAKSGQLLVKALDIAIRNDFALNELHSLRVSLNNIYFLTGDFEAATKMSTEGLIKAEKLNDLERMAHFNNVLGCVMMKLKKFDVAKKYFSEEFKIGGQTGDKTIEVHALMNLADHAIAVNSHDEAISYINAALPIYKKYKPLELAKQLYAYHKLSEVYKTVNNIDSSLKYCLLTIDSVEKRVVGNVYDRASYYVNAGDIYNRIKQPKNALKYLRTGLKWADSIKHREILRDVYEQFSVTYALIRNFDSAYAYQQKFSSLKDSILNENSERDILQKEADLKVEREKRIQEAELSRQRIWRNVIIAGLVFAILVTIMLYNRRRIRQKMFYQQQLNRQQNEMMNAVIATQDKERKRIAEDLHDSLGSILSAAKLKLSSLEEAVSSNGNKQTTDLDDTMRLLDEAVNEMRNISHNLLPASLLRLGLAAGLQNLFDKITAKSGLQITFTTYGFKERLDEATEVSIYRIILEAINNVIKHAKANNVTVQLMQHEDYTNILIEDDGIGFDKESILQGRGIGLNNIYSRVDHMKGKVDLDTKPKAGTVINIDIPYQKKTQ